MHIKNLYDTLTAGERESFRTQIDLTYEIFKAVSEAGGRAVIVGGTVRDLLLKIEGERHPLKDIDLEVFGLETDRLKEILLKFGKPLEVGMSFAVLKLGAIDISLPRKDINRGPGHTSFDVETDPGMDFETAARRRSFTISAIGLDLSTGELLDSFGGIQDLEKRILRAVDKETFVEDSLRVLRGMQFVGRFGLEIDPETLSLCRSVDLSDISEERVGEEWMKLLLMSRKPSTGLEAALDMGILEKLHSDLFRLKGVPQEKDWHPEGDVWEHTKIVVDAMADICARDGMEEAENEVMMLAALLHDIGKPETTEVIDGRIRSNNHNKAGLEPAERFMKQLKRGKRVVDRVLPLIEDHLFMASCEEITNRAVRRLSVRLMPATIRQLGLLIEADLKGKMASDDMFGEIKGLLRKADELELLDSMPEPLLTGKELIKRGFRPGREMGEILDRAYQAQLNGDFHTHDEAVKWLEKTHR